MHRPAICSDQHIGGYAVPSWAFTFFVALTTRFSFWRFHHIGLSSHDGLTQRAAPITSRLRLNDSCKYISTSDLKCSARGARRRTRGSTIGLGASRRIDDKVFVVAIPLHRADRPRWLYAACRAGHIAIACEWQLKIYIDQRFEVFSTRCTSADTSRVGLTARFSLWRF